CDKNGYDGDGVYIITYQSSGFVKRLQFTNDQVQIISDNPRYKTMTESTQSDDFTVVGKVRYVLHKM
ncbi:MAG: helix-turn-helix transcriptional regulator, partial [Treponema sp.]|nr:helix-turn-helix transcriptional regulator [Treponema sp.]